MINCPLLPFEDDVYVIIGVPPPELHLLLRSFNKLWKAMAAEWSRIMGTCEDLASSFAISINAVPSSYMGHDFVGNKCLFLLKNLDKLAKQLPKELHCYVDCFNALYDVVKSCFSVSGPVDNGYLKDIERFIDRFSAVDVVNTPSIHCVCEHIKDFYELNGTTYGLGLLGEQSGESVHYDFEDQVYVYAYKRPETHPQHGVKLWEATAKYNSNHILG